MNKDDLDHLKNWFSDYCKSFYSSDDNDQKNIILKEEHTHHVCKNILEITKDLHLDENRSMLAETAGLFHDIGRFPQYAKYRTFRDSISTNHGALGAQTLVDEKVLCILPEDDQEAIIQTVKFHNAYLLPHIENTDTLFYLKLVRDADKLDIWRLFYKYYIAPTADRPSAVGLGLSDLPEYSGTVMSCIFNKQLAKLSDLRTLNDFKLLKLTWVFDLNFLTTIRALADRNYIDQILSTLPQTAEILKAGEFLKDHLKQKLEAKN